MNRNSPEPGSTLDVLRFVADVSERLSASLDQEQTLAALAALAVPFLADWCVVHLVDRGGAARVVSLAHVDPGKVARAREIQNRVPPDRQPRAGAVNVIRSGEVEFCPNLTDAELVDAAVNEPHLEFLRQLELRSAMVVPIRIREEVVGAMTLAVGDSGRRYTKDDLAVALDLARRAGLAIENARLYHQAQEAAQAATAARDEADEVGQQLAYLFDNLDQVFFSIDLLKGKTLRVSRACEAVYGVSTREFLTDPSLLKRLVADADREIIESAERRFRSGQSVAIEYRLRRPDGAVRWVETKIKPARDQAGQVVRIDGVTTDVTDRKQAELALRESNLQLQAALEDLQRTQAQLIQHERLRALGQMASGIAHDFNNSLAQVIGYLELVLLHPQVQNDPRTFRTYLEYASTAAQDAASVVNRLREFYRFSDAGERHEPVDLNEQVRQAVMLTQPRWRNQAQARGIEIHLELALNEIPSVLGSTSEIREVLANLILNAADAIETTGTIRITTTTEEEQVQLEVADSGVGMSEDVRIRCFEPFFTTKGPGGSGLGLAMVYGIVQRHHGTIVASSDPGQGTIMTILLPRFVPRPRVPQSNLGLPPDSRSLSVLVVDDEPRLRVLLRELLEAEGHRVELAADGRQALDQCRATVYDLVFTDRAMPELSGDQFAQALKAIAPRTPVIMLTGFGDLMRDDGERPKGVDLVIPKPVTGAALRQAIAEVLRRG